MTRPHHLLALPVLALAAVLSIGACSSGNDDSGGVASLDQGAAPSASASGDLEKQLNDYVSCLRDNGANVPDPTVDDKGRVSFGGAANGQSIDRDKLREAQEKCGPPPEGLTAGFRADDPALQDAALKFAECMRKEGVDLPDPDFSKTGQGGAGPFGEIDTDDPKVKAGIEVCQKVWADTGVAPRGGGN